MSQDLSALCNTVLSDLHTAEAHYAESGAALARARAKLALIETGLTDERIRALPACTVAANAHRREHRPGVQAKLDGDPEVRAFVLARIDRMTYRQIADEVALHFPVERHVKRSSIHLWWQNNKAQYT